MGSTRTARVGLVCALLGVTGGRGAARADGALPQAGHLLDRVWVGAEGEAQWRWSVAFLRPVHLGALRARFGESPTSGVPTDLRWEIRRAGTGCGPGAGDDGWETLEGTVQTDTLAWPDAARPTRRSWFVDADACALRLVVDRTNAGPPVLREVRAIESARDVLRGLEGGDDGAADCCAAAGAFDGTYAGRWAGAPGKGRWTLRGDLPEAMVLDRVRLVLGFDAAGAARAGGGRRYGIAWAPVRYTVEVSEDGARFEAIAAEPRGPDGEVLPVRRRLVRFPPRRVKTLRLVMVGATGASGIADPSAGPVVREVSAYRADDPRPVLAPLWVLSVNANPSEQAHRESGGEALNDAFHAKFLQQSLSPLMPALEQDDRFARMVGPYGEARPAPPGDDAGEVLESVEADDPALGPPLLAASSPPPIVVLSGSNDWDFAPYTRADARRPKRWYWDPLQDASAGGMARLGAAVTGRVAPFLGFCGGAQILALLEARGDGGASPEGDREIIDRVLKRDTGHPIRGFAAQRDVEWAWPMDPRPRRALVRFAPRDPLFADVAGPMLRATTRAFPEAHADAIRADAFLPGAPLARLEVLATSHFCSPRVVAASPSDDAAPEPGGAGRCEVVPEAFRSRDGPWPVIGAQFHPEQRRFAVAAPGDPPESVDDPRLFVAAAFEQIVDGYEKAGF